MNTVLLIGRLTKDVELSYTPSNVAVARFTLAVDRPVQQGKEKQADFIRIVCFGKSAETHSRYINKGRQVAIHGRIQTGSYQNKDGQTIYTTDVVGERVEYLGGGQGGGQQQNSYNAAPPESFETPQEFLSPGEYESPDVGTLVDNSGIGDVPEDDMW